MRCSRTTVQRPHKDQTLFTILTRSETHGLLTITVGDRLTLPVFSSPFRAADYLQTVLASGPPMNYLRSSPTQLLGMFRDIEAMRIEDFALDRCPRCDVFPAYGTRSMKSASDLIMVWSVHKSTEQGRADLYFRYALDAARTGRLEISRDVALETVGHVTSEDPRPHLLLGQIAVRLKDRQLLREARAFLRFPSLAAGSKDSTTPFGWDRQVSRQLDSERGTSVPYFFFTRR